MGESDTRPANILGSLMDYASKYCFSIGHQFDGGVIRLTAITGSAATEIKGMTTHSACRMGLGRDFRITLDDKLKWKNTRLLVVDEISFAGYDEVLRRLSKNLQELTDEYEIPFGTVPILFIGDFMQLNPTNGAIPIYMEKESLLWEEDLNMLVELKGNWRFKGCPHLSEIFPIYRRFGLTPEIRKRFNSRVIGQEFEGTVVSLPDIRHTKVTTFHNRLRAEANDCVFLEHLRKYHSKENDAPVPDFTVIVKANPCWSHNHIPLGDQARQRFFREVTSDHIRDGTKKSIDPLLCLFFKCELMYRDNDDVNNGVANGTTARFEYLVMREGTSKHKVCYNGYWVWAVHAEEVEYMKMSWTGDSAFRGTFCVAPKSRRYQVEISRKEFGQVQVFKPKMTITQFLVTINHATTGHKLQGKTVDSLIVWEWSKQLNWIYVVLSRVRSIRGLYLREKLPEDVITAPHPSYLDMMDRLRQKMLPKPNCRAISDQRATYMQIYNIN